MVEKLSTRITSFETLQYEKISMEQLFIEFFESTNLFIVSDIGFLDSLMLCMTRPLNELVKPELKEEWETTIYPKFFVRDENDINQVRQPGLFKAEAVVHSGSMVALRNIIK